MLASSIPTRSLARVVPIPKPGGTRWLTLLSEEAAEAYADAVAEVAPAIETRLGPYVFANRVARYSPLSLEPWRSARSRFKRVAIRLAEDLHTVAVTDVRDCFASIRDAAVEEALLRLACEPRAVARIVGLLRGFARDGIPGLPIGPEPSAVLANAVLSAADEALEASGSVHLRWVDDFVVVARHAADAGKALEQLRGALEAVGLSVNERKTRIHDGVAFARAALLRGPVSDSRAADRLRSDAHALSSLAGENLLPPPRPGIGSSSTAATSSAWAPVSLPRPIAWSTFRARPSFRGSSTPTCT